MLAQPNSVSHICFSASPFSTITCRKLLDAPEVEAGVVVPAGAGAGVVGVEECQAGWRSSRVRAQHIEVAF